jgi:hypothetical protein
VANARVLLQDRVEPYRYETDQLVAALNIALQDARRIRPDLFIPNYTIPVYSPADMAAVIVFPDFYLSALLYFVVGFAQMMDQEDTSDARASALLGTFTAKLIGKALDSKGSVSPV